jgi:hypothetical protein
MLVVLRVCRVMSEIERTLRRLASTPHTKCSKGKVEGYKFEIQQILNILNATTTLSDDDVGNSVSAVRDQFCGVNTAADNGTS